MDAINSKYPGSNQLLIQHQFDVPPEGWWNSQSASQGTDSATRTGGTTCDDELLVIASQQFESSVAVCNMARTSEISSEDEQSLLKAAELYENNEEVYKKQLLLQNGIFQSPLLLLMIKLSLKCLLKLKESHNGL